MMVKQPNKLLTKRVESAARAVLHRCQVLSYAELFVEMGVLSGSDLSDWKTGKVPYLEKVIHCNLTKLSRIVTAVRRFSRENNLVRKVGLPPKMRYSKTANPFLEDEYRAFYSFNRKSVSSEKPDAHPTDIT